MRILLIFLFFNCYCYSFPETVQETLGNVQQESPPQKTAAPTPLKFDWDQISDLKEQPEFDYTEEVAQENWWTKFKRYLRLQWQNFLRWLTGDHNVNSILLFFLDLLPYLIMAGILIFAIWLFTKLNPAGSYLKDPKAGSVFLNEEEEIVQSRDIPKLIEEAIASGNYRLAVRFHYLLILQKLAEAGFIDYQFSKTDEEYLTEIKEENLQQQFSQITRIYDFTWYGNFEVNAGTYPRARKEFDQMQEQIKSRHEQNV